MQLKRLLIIIAALNLALLLLNSTAKTQSWPSSWIQFDDDPNEDGTEDDRRDVDTAYYNFDTAYVYFRLHLRATPNFTIDEARYKFFIDLDCNSYLSGGNLAEAEYMLFVEDTDDNGTGDVYLLNDTDNDGSFNEWESPPDYYSAGEVTDTTIAGYRITGNHVDLYVMLDSIDNPASICITWATDQENPNLDQAPTTDRPDVGEIPLGPFCLGTPPIAQFTADQTTICEDDTVTFTDASTGSPTSWSWSFPGGSPASAATQGPHKVVYSSAGTYNVTLIVSNACGTDTLTKIDYVRVYACAPEIEVTKTDADVNGADLEPGDTLLYAVVISNSGNMDQGDNTGNEFEDSIPTNTTFDNTYTPTATSGAVVYNAGQDRIEWNGVVSTGASVTITFRVIIDLFLPNGTVISNQGTVNWDSDGDGSNDAQEPTDDPDTGQDDDPTLSIVTALPLLEASKYDELFVDADTNGMPSPGDVIRYTTTITNIGKAPATNVIFDDTPDSNTTLVVGSVINTQGTLVSGNNSGDTAVVVNIGTIPIGYSVYIVFQVAVDDLLPVGVTYIANQGYVISTEISDEPTDDPHTPVDDDPTKTRVTGDAFIETFKTDSLFADILGDRIFGPGDTILYKVNILSTGNTAATGVTFNDTPDTNTFLVVGSVLTSQGVVTSGNNLGDTSISVDIGVIPSGSSVVIMFLVSINDPLPLHIEQIANQGYVDGDELTVVFTDDPDTPQEVDSTLTPIGVPDIDLSDDSHNYGGVPYGNCSPWTLTVCNVGTAALIVYSIESDNPLFIVDSHPFPQIIQPSDCIDVALKFCPIADCCFKFATISIISNDPDEEILGVALRGYGVCPDIAGKVKYYSDGAAVKDVTMTLSGGESSTNNTNSMGLYIFQNLTSGLDYTVTPSKVNTTIESAISSYDAAILLQHLVGVDTLSEYQQIAGDVSGNEALSAYDASLILQYAAHTIDHFPIDDWNFVPTSRSYTPLVADERKQNYVGILAGDISGNWSSCKKAVTLSPIVGVWLPDTTCAPGDTIIVPIYVSDVVDLGVISASMTLTFDTNSVSTLGASLGDIVSADWLIVSNSEPGQIIIVMAGVTPLDEDGSIAKIEFVISHAIQTDEPATIHFAECRFNEGNILANAQDGRFYVTTTSSVKEPSEGIPFPTIYEMDQNWPNPFNNWTIIRYQIPIGSYVNLSVYSLSGQLVRTLVSETKETGHYSVKWDGRDNFGRELTNGVYFYKIQVANYTETKKIILLR